DVPVERDRQQRRWSRARAAGPAAERRQTVERPGIRTGERSMLSIAVMAAGPVMFLRMRVAMLRMLLVSRLVPLFRQGRVFLRRGDKIHRLRRLGKRVPLGENREVPSVRRGFELMRIIVPVGRMVTFQGRPFRGVAPGHEGGETAEKAGPDAA